MTVALETALLGVYRRPDTRFVSGEGSTLVAEDGRRYLDFTSGIGVNALGYGHPVIRRALTDALATGLVHTSNLYRTEPAEALAALLVEHAFPGRVFFCNSGAEAGEACLKFARRWAGRRGDEKVEVVAFRGGFHGRLFGTLAITDRPAYQRPFRPLMPGARFGEVGDLEGVARLVDPARTAAVMIEPVQGEGGVRPVPWGFLRDLRALCTERETLLVFDEVQCGLGRTGRVFAWEHAGVAPDLLALAKPLAGGLPMGAVVLAEAVAEAVEPGDHATTFGGGPLVAAVARAVVAELTRPELLADVRRKGRHVEARLRALQDRRADVVDLRGLGLMWGLQLDGPVEGIVASARERGLLVVGAGPDVVRILPPLTVSDTDLERGLDLLEASLP